MRFIKNIFVLLAVAFSNALSAQIMLNGNEDKIYSETVNVSENTKIDGNNHTFVFLGNPKLDVEENTRLLVKKMKIADTP